MENKNEVVKDIAEKILHHRRLETEKLKGFEKNFAIGQVNVHYFDKDMKIWLTNRPNLGGVVAKKDIVGEIDELMIVGSTTITEDGKVVYKNSQMGELLITRSKGVFPFYAPSGIHFIEIFNSSFFIPHPDRAEALDITMNLDEPKPRRYRSLADLLTLIHAENEALEQLEEEEAELAEQIDFDVEELAEIARQIEAKKEAINKQLSEVKSFIRQNAELRYQPILDPWQEEIKRSNIFKGTVAIDGGPGTGKTTSLIQRIKFLTDKQALLGEPGGEIVSEGYLPNLTKAQQQLIFGNEENWIFFTPNELLKQFLQNSMVQEGLKASDNNVKIWKDYKKILIRQYKLVNSETDNPFLFLTKFNEQDLLPTDGRSLRKILNSFQKYWLTIINDRLNDLASMDVKAYSWSRQGESIQKYINRQEKDYTLDGLIRLYFNIEANFSEEVKEMIKEYNDAVSKAAAALLKTYRDQAELQEKISPFLNEWIRQSLDLDGEEEDNEEEDNEQEDTLNDIDFELFLNGKAKVLVRSLALSKYDKSVKISKKYKQLQEFFSPYFKFEDLSNFDKIGQLAYFNKYFVRSTKGIVSNIITEIPRAYKQFRKKELLDRKNSWNFDLLKFIVEDDKSKNKRIHPEEQAFLLYVINTTIKRCYTVSKLKSDQISHSYFEAYKESSIPVIGVDEATDFHLIDLVAIHSLSSIEISSVTYSGDLMQRLTKSGIRDWNDLKPFISDLDVRDLKVSYRQSPTLLEIATKIYEQATGREAEYISFMNKDEKEPKPLLYLSEDEDQKIEWIAKRILEIYKAYGKLIPAIAVFLPGNSIDLIREFAKKLRDCDMLADNGINVEASLDGRALGDKNMVRVFPVDKIKGMEFEAVFFS